MRELVVISGKGGTGKTSLTAALASFSENTVLCDADVDAANLYLLMNPKIIERRDFQGGGIALINSGKCTQCGLCRELCRFDAIFEPIEVDPIACEGCGVCVDFCPEAAIEFPHRTCGEWYLSDTRFGPMVHARLGIAEENSGKLVALVRQEAKKMAERRALDLIITDGPPGVGCPVIASIGGATAVLIVTEPTVSGLHDMQRVADLSGHFKVPCMLCINKYDLNTKIAAQIEQLAAQQNMEFLGRIAFDPTFIRAMVEGKTITEYDPKADGSQQAKAIWERIIASPIMAVAK